ncbi:hypothetical protein EDB86DRAFT_3248275 [Lactarius hatsudake]|nr:hypothetical protein EDB86DRAFT_3248275 [Lactarius hatsudake]
MVTHPTRTRTLSSPAFLHSPTESAHAPAPPLPPQYQATQPTARLTAGTPEPPIPLSFVLAHVSRLRLPVLARVSKRFSAAAQLALYRTLKLSADDADACVARLAGAPHFAALVMTLALCVYLPAHVLTLPAFNAELLATAPGTLMHLTLLADTLPYAFFDGFLTMPTCLYLLQIALSFAVCF